MGLRGAVIPTLVFAFATWAVYLGGLAAVQATCSDGTTGDSGSQIANLQNGNQFNTAGLNGVYAFSATTLRCSNLYRYHWFVMAFELLLILGALIAVSVPHRVFISSMHFTRPFWIGMFAVATVLYMIMSEAFLAAISTSANGTGGVLNRFRCAAAGAIMTVVANIAVMYSIGTFWESDGGLSGKHLPTTASPAGVTAV